MSKNRDLFAGAIAETKAVKNMAIENAKLALEETFTPQIKTMFSAKLREMEEEEMESMEEIESVDEMEEVDEMMFDDELEESEETEVTEELDLDELLAEIESEESEELNEVEEETEDEESEESEEETPLNIEDMTEEDLAKMIEDIMLEEFPQLAQMKDEEVEEEEEDDMDLDLDIEDETEEESDLDLAEMLREIDEELEEVEEVTNEELEELRAELNEAYSTIEILKTDLNEINVLNAKLLYTNKIFRDKNLNENQKVKVLSSFDKAESVNEVKLVYNTLNEGLVVLKPTVKRPSLGSASKSTIIPSTKKPIIESNEAYLRMQKLAGIIK